MRVCVIASLCVDKNNLLKNKRRVDIQNMLFFSFFVSVFRERNYLNTALISFLHSPIKATRGKPFYQNGTPWSKRAAPPFLALFSITKKLI